MCTYMQTFSKDQKHCALVHYTDILVMLAIYGEVSLMNLAKPSSKQLSNKLCSSQWVLQNHDFCIHSRHNIYYVTGFWKTYLFGTLIGLI